MPCVYALIDKSTKIPFYVGCTQNTYTRLAHHKTASKTSYFPVYSYIRENNIEIDMQILESFTNKSEFFRRKREALWIRKLIKNGIELKNSIIPKKVRPNSGKKSGSVAICKDVLKEAKIICIENGWTLQSYVTDAVDKYNKKYKKILKIA